MKNNRGKGKLFISFLSTVLAAALAFSGVPAAFAENGNEAESGGSGEHSYISGGSTGGVTLGKLIDDSGSGKEEKDPLEDTVVVLMEDDSLTSEKKVRNTLAAGDQAVNDIKVEDVWDFHGGASGMKLQDDGEQDEQDDAVVALVSSDSMNAGRLAKKLNKRKDVLLAEKNFKVHAASVSNDEYSDHQWSMQSNDSAPNVEFEWNEKGTTGTDKIVAVVDTGVDYTHPDLKNNMWVNTHRQIKGTHGFDFINGDPDPMDDNGHGTHCAGIIGAKGNNNIGISGVNQNVRIMALKCLDVEGSAWFSHEVAAYNYINKALDLGEPVVAINNSWGGGEESEIFARLIDIVGEKGAASVFAAGNDGVDSDEEPPYPAGIDSPYSIDVAATDRAGDLAEFSNYGETVDIAAPGVEILSTVPFYTYNPTIYGSRQDSISAAFNSYTNDTDTFGVPDKFYINGEECQKSGGVFSGENGQEIRVERADEGFGDGDSRSIRITYKHIKENDIVSFLVPYEVEQDAETDPVLSYVCKTKAPKKSSQLLGSNVFGTADLAEDEKPDLDTIGDKNLSGIMLVGERKFWDHITHPGEGSGEAGEKRKFAVFLYSSGDGDYSVTLDDMGMSRQDIKKEAFGQYDYMSGTSMATPFITGAVALKMAEKEKQLAAGQKLDIADVLNEISAMAKPEPKIDTRSEGTFDFRLVPTVLPPRAGKATVDISARTIKISGSGLYPDQEGFKVEVGKDDDNMKQAVIISKGNSGKGTEVLIKDEGWINNVENVRVTGANGKVSQLRNVYLVRGKKEYTRKDDLYLELSGEAVCTDGKNIYGAWSPSCEIRMQNPKEKESYSKTIATVMPSKIFTVKKDKNTKYGMLFGKDLVYANGLLYNVVEYGAANEIEDGSADEIVLGGKKKDPGSEQHKTYDDEERGEGDQQDSAVDEFEGPYSIYSGEYRLISIGTTAGDDEENEVRNLGKLPAALEDLDDYTMAAYNGKLYFIGGSRGYGDSKTFSNKVFVYDPATKKWSSGPALPSKRAGGNALQSGDKLIYTLGETEKKDDSERAENDFSVEMPDNLVFDGKTWRACSVKNPLVKMYDVDVLSVGLTKKGLIYAGAPVNDYGDTFIYDKALNKYADYGFNYLGDPLDYGPRSVVVGSTLYSIADSELYTIPVESGLVNVTVKKSGKGTVKGAGGYLPGNNATITVKADKNYHIKSITAAGKKVKVKAGATKQTVKLTKLVKDQTITVKFEKSKKVKVTVKKTGKGKVTGAGKHLVGSKVKIKVTAAKGYYIKSMKVGSKKIKLGKKATKKVYTIKKIKKATKVKVVFARK